MQSATLDKLVQGISANKRHIITSDIVRELLNSADYIMASSVSGDIEDSLRPHVPSRVEWRILDHCSAISRLYALFENYVGDAISDYVNYIQRTHTLSDISAPVQDYYRIGISKILKEISKPKLSYLNLQEMIVGYGKTLSGRKPIKLEPLAFKMHEQNLRLTEINRLFSGLGLDGINKWVERHPKILDFFGPEKSPEGAEKLLQNLIGYRNEAAHQGLQVDDILGKDEILKYCDFLLNLSVSIHEFFITCFITSETRLGFARECGKVSESLKGGRVVVAPVVGSFFVGQTLYVKGSNYCHAATIEELRLDNKARSKLAIETPTEVGFRLSEIAKKKSTLISLNKQRNRAGGSA